MVKTFVLLPAVAAAATCTGGDDPVISAAKCYRGAAGALGLKETVTVKINSFSAPNVALDISGSGIETFSCVGKTAVKNGQDVNVDFGTDNCLPKGIEVSAVKYCSDQDEIKVTVKDTAVPLPISAQLKVIDCSATDEPTMFDDFKDAFGKTYNGDEDAVRKEVFDANVKTIIEQNRAQLGYTLGVNQFADLTLEEFKDTYLQRHAPAESDVPELEVHEEDGSELAATIDWSSQGAVTNIKDQGSCGGCWSFAATGALEGANFVTNHKLTSLSEQQFLDCDKTDSGCNGGLEYQGWDFFKGRNEGICTEGSYPYKGRNGQCAYSSCTLGIPAGGIKGVSHVSKSASSLQSALNKQPVAVGIQADQSSFQFYNSGILTGTCGSQLDHSVLAVGYASDYWKVKNSWGSSWGESGYVRISTSGDKCGILDDASYPTVGAASVTV